MVYAEHAGIENSPWQSMRVPMRSCQLLFSLRQNFVDVRWIKSAVRACSGTWTLCRKSRVIVQFSPDSDLDYCYIRLKGNSLYTVEYQNVVCLIRIVYLQDLHAMRPWYEISGPSVDYLKNIQMEARHEMCRDSFSFGIQ